MTQAFVEGLRIEAERQALTPHLIARQARLTEATVIEVLAGRHQPCPRMQQLLAQAVHSTPDALYQDGDQW